MLIIGAALGGILLFLLATASANTSLFSRHYPLLLGLSVTACGTTDDEGDNGASGGDCSVKLAFLGPLTGDYANLGINILNGADLALKEYKGDCKVEIVKKDSQGDPEKAKPLALEIEYARGLVGRLIAERSLELLSDESRQTLLQLLSRRRDTTLTGAETVSSSP